MWDAVTGEQVKKMGEHKDIVNRWGAAGAGSVCVGGWGVGWGGGGGGGGGGRGACYACCLGWHVFRQLACRTALLL